VSLLDLLRPRCPTCEKRGLRIVQFIRATIVIDGQLAPAAWTFYRCPRCGGRFRQDVGGPMQAASDDDWRQHVAPFTSETIRVATRPENDTAEK
jgi:hypothetical protein